MIAKIRVEKKSTKRNTVQKGVTLFRGRRREKR